MKVLVTGSAGFIGQHLLKALAAAGHEPVGLDIRPHSAAGCEALRCDLLDAQRTKDALCRTQPDAVVHLAARTDLAERENIEGYAANHRGTAHLLEAMANTASVRRCIFASTQLVCRVGHTPTSDRDYCPSTLYGESKVRMEQLIRERCALDSWCIVRPTTVWGPGMSAHYLRFLRMVRRGRYFHVGEQPLRKSYGYVGNVAHQLLRLLEVPAAQLHRRVLYVADYEPMSIREWVNGLQREFGAPPVLTVPEPPARWLAKVGDCAVKLGFADLPFTSFRLNNLLTEYRFDLDPTRELCGELPYTMEQGIRETVAWVHSQDADESGARAEPLGAQEGA